MIRVPAAVIAATLIVSSHEKERWYELYSLEVYYPALLASIAIAVSVIETIYWMNRKLDRLLFWLQYPLKRLFYQFLLGVLLPLGISIGAAAYYYDSYGYKLSQTVYFEKHFLPIVLMVLLTNLYYGLQFTVRFLLLMLKDNAHKAQLLADHDTTESLAKAIALKAQKQELELAKQVQAQLILPKDCFLTSIYLWQSVARNAWAYHDNDKSLWPNSLQKTLAALSTDQYFQINKSCIVKRGNIDHAFHYKGRSIQLVLKFPVGMQVIVVKNHKLKFIKWFNQPIAKMHKK